MRDPVSKDMSGIPEDDAQLSYGLHIPTYLHTYSPSTYVYPHIQEHIREYTFAFRKDIIDRVKQQPT